jgi:hypothetical protein
MRKLATWLGIAAIALQIAWPLIAVAKPRAVTLVPLCTVDGVTHYLEVPTGKAPPEESSSHGDHCALCCLGLGAALVANYGWLPACADAAGALAAPASFLAGFFAFRRGARAPPSMPLPA